MLVLSATIHCGNCSKCECTSKCNGNFVYLNPTVDHLVNVSKMCKGANTSVYGQMLMYDVMAGSVRSSENVEGWLSVENYVAEA